MMCLPPAPVDAVPAALWSGKQVWVTRPRAQADYLRAQIAARGAHPHVFPLLEILPPDAAECQQIKRLAASLSADDLLFFVSANAVQQSLPLLQAEVDVSLLRMATVGRASAAALQAFGIRDVIAPTQGFDSEAVLDLAEFSASAVTGRRVVIFRGDGGRALFSETLRSRGARVEIICCYHRRVAQDGLTALFEAVSAPGFDALLLTSSEAARALPQIFGKTAAAWQRVRQTAAICGHARVAEAARAAGLQTVISGEAGDDGLLATLNLHFAGQKR